MCKSCLSTVRGAGIALALRKFPLVAMAVAVMACDRSKPELEKTVAQMQQISAEKDTLLRDVTATSQFIVDLNNEIDKTRLVAGRLAKNASRGETEDNMSLTERRSAVLQKVRELTARLKESDARLVVSRKRVAEMAGADSSMKVQLAAFDSTLTAFKSIMENQKAELASLGEQVQSLTTENTQLKSDNFSLVAEKTQLGEDRDKLTTERNTVYYIVGTKESLLASHVIVQTGGMLGIGKVAVPARDLSPSMFTSIDKTVVGEIPLPKANTPYRVITRQDLSALESTPDKHGAVMNSLKIKNADAFWAGSKYLIVIEQ